MTSVEIIRAEILEKIDWDAVYRRLRVFAFKLASGMPGVFDGISPDDLVGKTLVPFLAHPDGLGWDPTCREQFLTPALQPRALAHRICCVGFRHRFSILLFPSFVASYPEHSLDVALAALWR